MIIYKCRLGDDRVADKEKKLRFLFLLFLISFYFIANYYFEKPQEEIQKVELRETSPVIQEEKKENLEVKDEVKSNNKNNVETDASDAGLKIYFVDVGQADCILISNNGKYVLIDAGNNDDGKKLVSYFKSLGVQNFQYVIGTHAHEDHIGGMDDIIYNFSISHFFMPDVVTTTKTFEDVLDALEAKNIAFETPNINDSFTMGDIYFTVLWVGHDKTDLNDTSIVVRATYKETSYLFMGDAPSQVEKGLLDKHIESDLLKVGHHGSQYSSSAQFLKKVDPKYAIIQVGRNNIYSHPKQVVLDKLNRMDVKVYRTDQDGTIIVSSDGKNMKFDTVQTDTNG